MSLTQEQCNMIKSSWKDITSNEFNSLRFVMDFYSKVFDIAPSAKSLFKGGMTEQGKALIGMLSTVVNNIESLSSIKCKVESLGEIHGKYGVTRNMYIIAGRALVSTLSSRLPNDENKKDYENAWMDAYSFLASVMSTATNNNLEISTVRQFINPSDFEEKDFKRIMKTDKTLKSYIKNKNKNKKDKKSFFSRIFK